MSWHERTVVRDGVRLFCRDRGGPGQPVVLLHGVTGHSGEWDDVAEHLGPGYRLVAVDQRGHGRSEPRPADVSRAAYVADVVAVLDQLELGSAVLVGQSLGGHTAILTAAAHPDRVRALVVVDASPGGRDQLARPPLVVIGRSGFVLPEDVPEMLRRRPGTVAVSVPGTGHDLHLERPDALADTLARFLGS